jgi:hypothetical protein
MGARREILNSEDSEIRSQKNSEEVRRRSILEDENDSYKQESRPDV